MACWWVADEQTVPLAGMFDVGGFSMAHPGDPSAPAEQVADCRCTVIAAESL